MKKTHSGMIQYAIQDHFVILNAALVFSSFLNS